MRINGPHGTTFTSSTSSARRSSGGGFTLDEMTTTTETRAASAPRAAAGIDALLALQGIEEDATERRRRSVARGKNALDLLDDLKIGMLAGTLDPAMVNRLRGAASDLKTSSGDPGLDQVLSEIELRVEVEIAKAAR